MRTIGEVISGLFHNTPGLPDLQQSVGSNMGIGTAVAYPPNFQNAAADQQRMQAAANSLQQYQQYQNIQQLNPRASASVTISVMHAKITRQAQALVDALPMSIAHHVHTCEFYPAFQEEPPRFVVRFDNLRELAFEDIDQFPSEEHIARIALECP